MQTTIKHDIAFLDFLRGWSSIFVFFHHAAILGGGPGFLRGHIGQEAVNAFMLASGFLIYFQCSIGKSYFGLENKVGIRNFFIRRFFRIAPVYYFCLIIALLLSSFLGECREIIAETLPHTMTSMDRYYIENPIKNFFIHISFIFGLLPSYAFSTPLPDWSLGLEMQFYFVFPLLFYFYKKNFPIFFFLSLIGMFMVYLLVKKLGMHYPMPSFLPIKFHNFSAGIALAYLLLNKGDFKLNLLIIFITLFFLYLGNKTLLIPILFLFSWWWICRVRLNDKNYFIKFLTKAFNHNSSKILAEMSYSIYIFHLIIMLPFFAFTLKFGTLNTLQWGLQTCFLLFFVALASFLIYKYIEQPGIKIGKNIIEFHEKKLVLEPISESSVKKV